MKQKTWWRQSDRPHFTAFSSIRKRNYSSTFTRTSNLPNHLSPSPSSSSSSSRLDLSALPNDVLVRITASFTLPNLRAASVVCRAWRDALKPLREAMAFFMWGKRFKHGRGGVKVNLTKALDSFLKAAARGSTLAMVDAGLIYWEMGSRDEAIVWYTRAAELGDPAGQCNLAISFLQADPPNTKEAIEWLYKASAAGHARAQYQLALCLHQGQGVAQSLEEAYQLALCLHQGQGVEQSLEEAACWYVRAAEGGYARAMYNTSLCYSLGEGLSKSDRLARIWMRKAADHGHRKAQFEHGLALLSEGETMNAVVYLELATRAGERAAILAEVKHLVVPTPKRKGLPKK